jgi:hypothetical protein
MTIFPALIPSTRTYSPGEYPITPHPLLSGSEIRVRHSNTVIGVRLRLTFQAVSSADVVAVRNHYNGRQGGFLPFAIPVDLLSGVTTPADFTPAGHQWVYASRPSVVDVPIAGDTPTNRHDLVVELVTVPPENTIVSGARITVRATVRGGSAQLGTYIESFASVVGGAATAEASTSALGAAITANASVFGGTATGDSFVDPLTAQVSVTGGAASAGDPEPAFSSVSLLLHMDGADGSTTFTDSSSFARTVTRSGNTQISTAQSKFGGASALFDGASDLLTMADASELEFTGDFAIETQAYPLSTQDDIIGGHDNQNVQVFRINWGGTVGDLGFFLNGATIGPFAAGIAANTWQHLAITRSGINTRVFVNGVQVGSTVTTFTGSFKFNRLGGMFGLDFHGHVDEFRITTGAARYTANFTPPSAPFPDS